MVFSTKDRRPWISAGIRPKLWAYMCGILTRMECRSITVGEVEDHVHILCNLTKKHVPIKVLETLKKESSKFAKTLDPAMREFYWQDGYGLFGVSQSHFEAARRYILGQEEHHRKVSFKEEFLRILKKCRIEYDERYVWQ